MTAAPQQEFTLAGARLSARASGALWREAERLLCVADLHLGKSEREAPARAILTGEPCLSVPMPRRA